MRAMGDLQVVEEKRRMNGRGSTDFCYGIWISIDAILVPKTKIEHIYMIIKPRYFFCLIFL